MSRHLMIVLLVLHVATAGLSLTQAQTGSQGCDAVNNNPGLDLTYQGLIFLSYTYFAGDIIKLVADVPTSNGTPTAISLQDNNITVATASFPGSISYTIPASGSYYFSWWTDSGNATWQVSCDAVHSTTNDREIPACPIYFDGRINNCDTAAPVAVYPVDVNHETGLHIYDVFTGQTVLLVSPQQINNAPADPDSNVLIAEANHVALYRITGSDGGLWQVNAPQYNGKTYVLIFPELFPNAGYISHEEE